MRTEKHAALGGLALGYVNLRRDNDHAPLPVWARVVVFVIIFVIVAILVVTVVLSVVEWWRGRRVPAREAPAPGGAGGGSLGPAETSPDVTSTSAAAPPAAASPEDGPVARYYAVNDRPVRLVPTPDGGLAGEVLDLTTGAFVPDPGAFDLVGRGGDVDAFDSAGFAAYVGQLRTEIAITWSGTGSGDRPYTAQVGGERWTLRMNDFPEEPLYTLLVDEVEQVHLDDWPAAWSKAGYGPA